MNKQSLDPASVEHCARWLEDMPIEDRQAFNFHAVGMLGHNTKVVGGVQRIGDHLLPYLAQALRASCKQAEHTMPVGAA